MAELFHAARQAGNAWLEHEGTRLSAALALYSLLSLAPLVLLSVATASVVFGRTAAQTALVQQVGSLMGSAGADAIRTVIDSGKSADARGLASALGILTLLIGASSVFGELQSALNKIWEVHPTRTQGVMAFVRSRLFSFAMVFAIGFLLLISLLMSALLTAFGDYFSAHLAIPKLLLSLINGLLSFAAIVALVALIMKYVPDARVRWADVWLGAIATALLFVLGKALLGIYLGKAAVGSAYGASGSLIVVIVWVYYSAMIFYFGAELTRAREVRRAALRAAGQGQLQESSRIPA